MLKAFRLTPITAAEEACRVLAAEPGILGRDWELLGAREEAGELLCRTPAGELVLVVTAPLADAALLARGLATLGRLRRALPLAPLLGGKGLRKAGEGRLLLLGAGWRRGSRRRPAPAWR